MIGQAGLATGSESLLAIIAPVRETDRCEFAVRGQLIGPLVLLLASAEFAAPFLKKLITTTE